MTEPEVSPSELKFRFQVGKQLPASISVHNPLSGRLAFKVKTTTPKKYVVRPSSGIVEPGTTTNIQVIMQAQKEQPSDFSACKDKFLVQTTYLTPEETDLPPDAFKKDERKDLKEVRLRVVLDGPPAPPSPVPEANENEEDVYASSRHDRSAHPEGTDARLRTALDDLALLTQQNRELKSKLDTARVERDDLRKKFDMLQLQKGGGGGSAGGKGSSMVSVVLLLLTAILAFLVGHYT